LAGLFTISDAAAGTLPTLESTDAGALPGPAFDLYRNSASPAANDPIGRVTFFGKDSGGTKTPFVDLLAVVADPTDGNEDGYFDFRTYVAGTYGQRFMMAPVSMPLACLIPVPARSMRQIFSSMECLSKRARLSPRARLLQPNRALMPMSRPQSQQELELDSVSTGAAANIGLQFSNNGGSSFVTSGYRRADSLGHPISGNQGGGSTSAPYIHLGGATAAGNNKSAIRHMLYFGASAVTSVGNAWVDAGLPASTQNAGDLAIANANALRVMLSTGTFNAGTRWSVRGHKRT
jgi:hypothetical protein